MIAADYSDYDGDQWYEEDEVNTPDSVLLSLVQSYDWAGTLARIASHPDGTYDTVSCSRRRQKWRMNLIFVLYLYVSSSSFVQFLHF
jgi:hypothetical protein